MSVAKERLEEMENVLLDADRDELISMAKEANIWIGDIEELSHQDLLGVVEEGLCSIKLQDEAKEVCGLHGPKTQNEVMDFLYDIKKNYKDYFKDKKTQEKFDEEFSKFFDSVRIAELPDITETEFVYKICLTTKKFSVLMSMATHFDYEGYFSDWSFGRMYEQEVDIENKDESIVLYPCIGAIVY